MAQVTLPTAKTFQFELVSPERVLVSEQAGMVVIPGEEGDFGVLAEHAPFLSTVRPGIVTVTTPDGAQKKIFVAGGFADVNDNVCAVLAEEAVNVADIDRDAAEKQLAALKEERAAVKDEPIRAAHLDARLRVAEAKVRAAA